MADSSIESSPPQRKNPAPYFRKRVLSEMFPSLMADIQPLPTYFQPNWLPDRFFVRRVGESPQSRFGNRAVHRRQRRRVPSPALRRRSDPRVSDAGLRPQEVHRLSAESGTVSVSLTGQTEPVDGRTSTRPDLAKFPLFAKAVPITFVLEPGELLFVPSRWWHTTKMLTPSITISINTVNRSNWRALVDYVAMRQSNPAVSLASRAYLTGAGAWRAWRDRGWRNRIPRSIDEVL